MEESSTQMAAPIVIQTFTAPRLELKVSRVVQKRREFLAEFRTYQGKCEAASQLGQQVQTVSLLSCFEESLLDVLLTIGAFRSEAGDLITTKEEVTEEALLKYLNPTRTNVEEVSKYAIRNKMAGIKWKYQVKFVEAIEELMTDVVLVLSKEGWRHLLEDESTVKWLLQSLREKIGVKKFREELETAHHRDEALEKSWLGTLKRMQDMAASYDRWLENKPSGAVVQSNQKSRAEPSKKPEKKSEKVVPYCLNRKTCNGKRHYIADCPDSSEGEKKELLEQRKKQKQKWEAEKAESKRRRIQHVKANKMARDVTRFMLEGECIEAEADSGSAVTVCPRRFVQRLQSRGVQVDVKDIPKRTYGIADQHTRVEVKQEATIGRLTMMNGGQPVDLLNVRMYISEDVPLLLLGRSILNEMGFSFADFLQKRATDLDGQDMSHVEPEVDGGEAKVNWVEGEPDEDVEASIPDLPGKEQQDEEFQELLKTVAEGEHSEELVTLIQKYKDVFYSEYSDKPAEVPPMKVELKEDMTPYHTPVRRYKPEQKKFLQGTFDKLVEKGLLYKVETAKWLSAPHLVDKPLPGGEMTYRFTVDLRSINLATVPERQNLPTVEEELAKFAGAKYFTNFDLSHCFWQFPLEQASREMHAISAPSGVYVPRRVLHGAKNASIYTQRVLAQVFAPVQENLVAYLDDHLIFGRTKEEWLASLEKYLSLCRARNLKLSPQKSTLFARDIVWCGRRITQEGITHQPRRLQALREMPLPDNAAQLQQYLAALNWMRTGIPDYERRSRPLQRLLKLKIREAGSAKANVLKKFHLQLGDEERFSFNELQEKLHHLITLSHFDPEADRILALHTDASDEGWAGILTSIPKHQEDWKVDEQEHLPISFLSGTFNETQKRWSTIEKEAFAVMTSMERLKAWTLTTTTRIHTDSRNVVWIYKPMPQAVATRLGLNNVAVSKLARWGLRLSAFDYRIKHRAGEENVFPDLLSRWGKSRKRISFIRQEVLQDRSTFAEQFWEELRQAQRKVGMKVKARTLKCVIPKEARSLINRVLTVAHGAVEHRSKKNTRTFITDKFVWKGMNDDIDAFVSDCLLCAKSRTGERIPRKLGNLLHGERPNELIHFDFLYIHPGVSPYLLLIKDDFSGFCLLYRCGSTDAESVVEALALWISLFGVPASFHSDTATHFKNEVMSRLTKKLGTHHTFSIAYAPQSNGTVERLCRSVLEVLRRITAREGRDFDNWANYVYVVQRVLNTRATEKLGGKSASGVFTNATDHDQSLTVMMQDDKTPRVVKLAQEVQTLHEGAVRVMMKDVAELHKGLRERLVKSRQDAIDAYNSKTRIQEINFHVGDYVLVGLPEAKKMPKLALRWRGPARIIGQGDHELTFEVQYIGETAVQTVHANRLRFYADEHLNCTTELLEHVQDEAVEFYVVQEVEGIREQNGVYEVQVKWQDSDERTWEPIVVLYKDCEEIVGKFVMELKDRKLRNRLRRILKL